MALMRIAALALALFLSAGAARADVTIDSVKAQGGSAQVSFTYRNTTGTTWATVVIECATPRALRREHRGVHYFSNHASGGIPPGFEGTASVRVPLKGGEASQITCTESGTPLTY